MSPIAVGALPSVHDTPRKEIGTARVFLFEGQGGLGYFVKACSISVVLPEPSFPAVIYGRPATGVCEQFLRGRAQISRWTYARLGGGVLQKFHRFCSPPTPRPACPLYLSVSITPPKLATGGTFVGRVATR